MRTQFVVSTFAALTIVAPALADSYPTRPITFVVPFAAGGPADTLARTLADPMSKILGQPIVVENIVGAGGSIAVGHVVHAVPDGYTVGIGNWSTHVVNGAIYPLSYDLLNDLEPVALLPSSPQVIVANDRVPADNLAQLVSWAKSNKANVATAGVGSASHASGLFFQKRTGAEITFVSYRSGGQALQDLVAGHVELMFDQVSNALPQIRAGAIKAYAVTAKSRIASAPDIPTVDEAGLPGFYISVWYGLWVPKQTPSDVISKLNAAVVATLKDASLRKRFADFGQEVPEPGQILPAALHALQKAEIDKWWPILKSANVKSN